MLVIAYVFPPLGGPGVFRTAKFVKYLPQFEWTPTVFCGDDGRPLALPRDAGLLADVPAQARVFRMPFVSPYGLRRRLHRLFRVTPTESLAADAEPAHSEGVSSAPPCRPPGAPLVRLGRALGPLESGPPDVAFYWALSVVPACVRQIKTCGAEVIYTSSSPYSDHIAGWLLKRLTRKPWVADFRDPWTQAYNYSRRGWRRRLDLFLEQRVLRYADRIIGVTPSQTQGLRDLVPGRDPSHFTTIENGYDGEDFRLERPTPDGNAGSHEDRTVLSYVGLVRDGTAVRLLELLARLGSAGRCLRVRFVGGIAPQEIAWLRSHPMHVEVEVVERVSHAEAIAVMRSSDALLQILGEANHWKSIYGGKLFEYMAAGRPILLAGPEGDASRLIEATGTGVRLPLERPDEGVALLGLLASNPVQFYERYYHPQSEVVARFDRRVLTGRLAALLNELAGSACRT